MVSDLRSEGMLRIPPFRDAHVHFRQEGKPLREGDLRELLLACRGVGILHLEDMGDKSGIGLRVKESLLPDLRVRSSGYALSRKGAYGAFLGRATGGGTAELREAVREIAEAGADFIKVINSGIVCAGGDRAVSEGGFSPGELRVLCGEAGERGLPVACHANSDEAVRSAVLAGVASIEHGFFVSEETLHLMRERGVAWTPTVIALLGIASLFSPPERRYIESVVEGHLRSLSLAASLGVPLRIGTDSGSRCIPFGGSFFDEMQLFRKAGLSREQILAAACMGREEAGEGNYLLVREDFIGTRRVEAVFREGRRVAPAGTSIL
ncbi:MAG: amidohydrolase family protein [Nitrospirales bacterium]|nr:amidohydrolase family protein [Nitrospirales bacterium]